MGLDSKGKIRFYDSDNKTALKSNTEIMSGSDLVNLFNTVYSGVKGTIQSNNAKSGSPSKKSSGSYSSRDYYNNALDNSGVNMLKNAISSAFNKAFKKYEEKNSAKYKFANGSVYYKAGSFNTKYLYGGRGAR